MTISHTGQRAALVDSNNIVQNVVVYQDGDIFPEGLTPVILGVTEVVSIGHIHNGDTTFTDPNPPVVVEPEPAPQPTLAELQAQLAQITAHINALANGNN